MNIKSLFAGLILVIGSFVYLPSVSADSHKSNFDLFPYFLDWHDLTYFDWKFVAKNSAGKYYVALRHGENITAGRKGLIYKEAKEKSVEFYQLMNFNKPLIYDKNRSLSVIAFTWAHCIPIAEGSYIYAHKRSRLYEDWFAKSGRNQTLTSDTTRKAAPDSIDAKVISYVCDYAFELDGRPKNEIIKRRKNSD